jgi:ribosomal protein S16
MKSRQDPFLGVVVSESESTPRLVEALSTYDPDTSRRVHIDVAKADA